MKKIILSALIAVAVAGTASAQDTQDKQPRRKGFGQHPYGMTSKLNLTEDQKKQMKTINEDFRKQMTELRKNEDITVKEWKSRMKSIQEGHKTKVQQVLTPEQKAQLEKAKQDRKGKFQKRGKFGGSHFGKDLNLTADQQAALKKQRSEMMQKMKAIREDKSLSEEQKKVEINKFREQQQQSLKSILTEEQINKLQQKKPVRQKPVTR
jgi:hypothetical protein